MVTIQGTIEHMHWVERDGQQLPRRIGGHAALDFCNTLAGWGGPPLPKGEWLRTYDVLVGWAGYADLLDADEEAALRGRTGARAQAVLDDARRLRGRLRTAVLDPSHVRAMSDVGAAVRAAAEGLRLESGAHPTWRVDAARRIELPLLRVAWGGRRAADIGRARPGQGLPRRRVRLAVPGPVRAAALVQHGQLRQPGQGARACRTAPIDP